MAGEDGPFVIKSRSEAPNQMRRRSSRFTGISNTDLVEKMFDLRIKVEGDRWVLPEKACHFTASAPIGDYVPRTMPITPIREHRTRQLQSLPRPSQVDLDDLVHKLQVLRDQVEGRTPTSPSQMPPLADGSSGRLDDGSLERVVQKALVGGGGAPKGRQQGRRHTVAGNCFPLSIAEEPVPSSNVRAIARRQPMKKVGVAVQLVEADSEEDENEDDAPDVVMDFPDIPRPRLSPSTSRSCCAAPGGADLSHPLADFVESPSASLALPDSLARSTEFGAERGCRGLLSSAAAGQLSRNSSRRSGGTASAKTRKRAQEIRLVAYAWWDWDEQTFPATEGQQQDAAAEAAKAPAGHRIGAAMAHAAEREEPHAKPGLERTENGQDSWADHLSAWVMGAFMRKDQDPPSRKNTGGIPDNEIIF